MTDAVLQIQRLARTLPAPARVLETHISWVILSGGFAYKLKKPVNLGFLDFSTPALRRAACEAEVRLNRRLAPDIYLDVLPLLGAPDAPRLGRAGHAADAAEAFDWAVRMRAFDADATLDKVATLDERQTDAIADAAAAFHASLPPLDAASPWGAPEQARAPALANFDSLHALLRDDPASAALRATLAELRRAAEAAGQALDAHFAARKAGGFIRECHGDLHLGNIAWINDAPLLFDGIEFSESLRCIDVLNDLAFLLMDLWHRGFDAPAWRLLNRYLEHTGDYAGLPALRYYLAYRALVRAKVAAIRARQTGGDLAECAGYSALAARLGEPGRAGLILMHGVSGSGKSVISASLLQTLGAIRLRSDVERKRLFGLAANADSAAIPGGIYTPEASAATRQHLLRHTDLLLAHGYTVIVDATFIHPAWRAPFRALAAARGAPCCLVSPQVAPDELRRRVAARAAAGGDASEADLNVLDAQLQNAVPLSAEERANCIEIPPNLPPEAVTAVVRTRLQAPGPASPDTD